MTRLAQADHVKCRECGRKFPSWSRTSGFCGGHCAALHRIRRREGPQAAQAARARWSKKELVLEGTPIGVEVSV